MFLSINPELMKRILSSLLFIIIFHFLGVFTACEPASCDGGDRTIIKMSDLNMESFYLRGNDVLRVSVYTEDTLSFDSVMLRFEINYGGLILSNLNGLFSSAVAEAAPEYQQIVDIEIISSLDYDEQHAAGTSLMDILVYKDNGLERTADYYVSQKTEKGAPFEVLNISFSSAPMITGKHDFTIKTTLEDGSMFTDQALPIMIK
jgi:hypothetical protein